MKKKLNKLLKNKKKNNNKINFYSNNNNNHLIPIKEKKYINLLINKVKILL